MGEDGSAGVLHGAIISWKPNNQTIEAAWEGRKATGMKKNFDVPGPLGEKLFGKKKNPMYANVTVEKVGNAFRIIKIET